MEDLQADRRDGASRALVSHVIRRLDREKTPDSFQIEHVTPAQSLSPAPLEPEFIPEEKVPDLNIVDLDLMVRENRKEHHTNRYAHKGLIVRRGQAFKVWIKLSDTFNKDTDRIVLKFMKGISPKYSKGTCFLVSSDAKDNDYLANGWTSTVSDVTDKRVTLAVTPGPDSVIGNIKVTVKVERTDNNGKVKVNWMDKERELIVLFNAFLPEDDANIEDDGERKEYVMNDLGLVYTNVNHPRHWNYGQFEKNVLEVALYLMDICFDLPPHAHGHVVKTIRAMSAMVNSIGDHGVLVGNWSGKYNNGTAPSKWNGSVGILQQFWTTKRPVRYGQCWVFSAVLTTVMRALGLATRTITNFCSAHDTDMSMTIDVYVNEEGDPIECRNSDSTWNFHVWNECWCKRPDLPKGYDGWQAFDATPQEISNGTYQCGPCPVAAIFNGEIHMPYDGHFIFAEVNSDTVYWKVNKDGSETPYAIKSDAVGCNISTKMPGKYRRLDITKNYKAKEGSSLERRGAINAMRRNKRNWEKIKEQYEKITKDWDVVFDLKTTIDYNEDCHLCIDIKNNADQPRVMAGKMHIYASYNVGISRTDLCAPLTSKITVKAGETESVKWDMPATEYFSKLDDDANLLFHAAFLIEGTNQVWSQAKVIEVMKPEIKVLVSKKEVAVGEEFDVIISFTNPVKVDLTALEVNLEGPGISHSKEFSVGKTLKPEQSMEVKTVMKAERPGDKAVVASIDSDQLMGLSAVAHFKVIGEEPD